ncbi:ABC transporter ATP-binding protein [Coprothermobacteraceae bacterium]|nr:ABC transporter ATP-binding protein [Coprothermobacteraceae bacterium]
MNDEMVDLEEQVRHRRDGEILRFVWRYARHHWFTILITLFVTLGAALASVLQPYLYRTIIDDYMRPMKFDGLAGVLLLYALLLLLYLVFSWLQVYLSTSFGQRITWRIRVDLMRHLMSLKVDYFSNNPVGKLVTRVTNDVANLNEMISAGFVSLMADLFLLLSIAGVMIYMDWRLALVALSAVIPIGIMLQVLGFAIRRSWRVIRRIVARMNIYLQELLSGFVVVKAFTREALCEEEFDVINREHFENQMKAMKYRVLFYPSVGFLREFSRALVLLYGGYLVYRGAASIGTIVSFFSLLSMFFDPIADFSDKYSLFQTAFASLEKIMDLLEVEDLEYKGQSHRGDLGGEVQFDHVTFAYGSEPVLKEVSFHSSPGKTLAIVGPTGAGKTTILNLLIGFYDNYGGSIYADRVELRDWDLEHYRSHLALVLQDVQLFHDTIRNNITLWDEADDSELEDILRTVNALFVFNLPDGLDYKLAPEGANLSQGQRQLIAFARALYHRPRILLLDEATANIDTDTERLIQEALPRLMRGRTTVAIAHRLSTIQQADRIVVIDQGRVVESGTHQELMARRGFYYELYTTQLLAGTAGIIEP